MLVLFLSRAYAYDISPRELAEQGPGTPSWTSFGLLLVICVCFVGFTALILWLAQKLGDKK
jgi:hypothetical protein